LEDLDDVVKTTSETGQAMMAYLGDDDDDVLCLIMVSHDLYIVLLLILIWPWKPIE
jgi:hypothetical protein